VIVSAATPGAAGRGLPHYTRTVLAKAIFWGSLGALAWTHVGYPAAAGALARARSRPVRRDPGAEPSVAVIVAAHDEEAVVERRVENLLAQDYPADRLEVVVASDASTDRTNELVQAIAAREPRVRLLDCPRGGKVAAQDRAVRETRSDVVAFSDANATWAPDALRQLVAALDDPDVAYVCGRLRLDAAEGSSREGAYWRYELWLREQESRLGSVTGGNGSIYAVRRADYVEVDPRWGHDLALPYRMVQGGRRAVYEPAALAFEKPTPTNETEYRRKVRMFEHCWEITLRGSMLRRLPSGYLVAIVSHRLLRYSSGVLHLALLGSSLALAGAGRAYGLALAGQLALAAAAAAGVPIARYYVLVTWATVRALVNYLRRGVPATWEAAEGTR
jgi:cellulose synthase/poly-beta-1,6-N-acetylglucosamine synthase-like glycosyltransferase